MLELGKARSAPFTFMGVGMSERLVEEFARLVKEYGSAEGSEKAEAWNLIADFAVENSLKICLALDRTFPAKAEGRAP